MLKIGLNSSYTEKQRNPKITNLNVSKKMCNELKCKRNTNFTSKQVF